MAHRIISTCIAAGLSCLLVVHTCPATETTRRIVIDEDAQSLIVIGSTPSDTEEHAAEELQTYIRKMIGITIPIQHEDSAGVLFMIGRCPATEMYLARFDQRLTGPGSDSFIIKAQNNRIILIGGGDRGTLYSVYALLEQQGCRWFMPGELGEVIPQKDRLVIEEGEQFEVPDFIQREIQGHYAPVSDDEKLAWHARNRINRENDLTLRISRSDQRWCKRGNYLNWSRLFHNYPHILPPAKYFAEHPEYYTLYKGRRIEAGYRKGNICTTNPEVIDRFVEYIDWWFKNNPDGSVFSLWPADGSPKWCECDACMALGGRNFTPDAGAMSRRHITFVNEVARRVYETYPNRLILLCAYHPNYLDPVMDMKLEKNVIVQVIHSGCHAHAIGKCPANRKQKERFEGWAQIAAPGLGSPAFSEIPLLAWDEYASAPRPVAKRIIDNLKYFKSLGSRYYYAQTGSVHTRRDAMLYSPFPYYVITKYAWDVDTDYDALCKDFFGKFYGSSSGEAMNKYWNLLEDAVQAAQHWHPEPWSEGAIPSAEVFTPRVLGQAEEYLLEAEELAESDVIKERLSYIRQSFDFVKKSIGGGRTTFTLKKGADFYYLNGGQEIFAGSALGDSDLDIIAKRTAFRNLVKKFIVAKLENDRLALRVVPAIGGRIVALVDKRTGTNFMWEPAAETTIYKMNAFYHVYGGYEELIGTEFPSPGWELPYDCALTEDDQSWGIILNAQVRGLSVQRTIRLQKGDLPEVAVVTRIINPTTEEKSIGVFVHPVMTINRNYESHYLSMLLQDGTVRKTHITAGLDDKPYGAWALVDEKSNVGIVNYFDPTQAAAKLHLAPDDKAFNMELLGTEHKLAPGDSLTLSHRYRVMDDAVNQVESELKRTRN